MFKSFIRKFVQDFIDDFDVYKRKEYHFDQNLYNIWRKLKLHLIQKNAYFECEES